MPRYDHMALLAKVETTYGTDSTPTAAANAMVLQQVEVTPMEADRVEVPRVRTYDAVTPVLLSGVRIAIAGTVDAAGSGTAGTPPGYAPLLRACGLAETIVAATRVDYTPVTRGHESATLYNYADSEVHKGFGARGDLTFSLAAKGLPSIRCAMQGLWVAPGAGGLPTADYSKFRDAEPADYEHTPTFTINGVAVPMQSFTLAMGNNVVHRDLVGKREIRITGRSSRVTTVFEAPESLAQNYYEMARSHARTSLALVHGKTAGNIVGVTTPKAQPLQPTWVNDNGIRMLSVEWLLHPTAGDDEFTLSLS